jgi:large subunit ribosomal protein L15
VRFPANSDVDAEGLRKAGVIKKRGMKIKLLGTGTIDRPLKITVNACTQTAREGVEKAGGRVEIVAG